MNVEEVNGDSWRRIKDFSSKVEAGARVLIGQKPQNCRADWRNIGFGKLSRNDGWVFEHIFSCSHYLFSGLQPPVSHYSNCDDTLFVFDLHAQTNNYINLYKLTKWTVISNCSLVTDPETQIQLKFTVSWQPSDTYECISTKIHFHKVRVEPLDIFLVCKYLSRCLFLLWIEKQNILMSRSAINHSSLLNFHLVYGGRLVWKVKRRHHFVNQTNILKCKAIKKAKRCLGLLTIFCSITLKKLESVVNLTTSLKWWIAA